jgi:transposase
VDVVVESGRESAVEGESPEARAVIAELERMVTELGRENARLRHHLDLLRRRVFGRSSEKGTVVVAEQQALPFEPAAAGAVAPGATDEECRGTDDEQSEVAPARRRRRHPGRRPLDRELPRQRIELWPAEAERSCGCCGAEKTVIGEDVTQELEYQPSSYFINEYARPVLACSQCRDGVVQAALPARPIEKGRPGPGLLAQVVTSKYADHLPLYRQEQVLRRHGIEVSRRTLSEWNGAVADLLAPIVEVMTREQILRSPWIQVDDTTLEVQLPRGESPGIRTGHMWVYRDIEGNVVYDFTWSRNRDGPLRMLAGYEGYLQADAAPAYDDVYSRHPEIREVACFAHARRYFKEAAPTAARECAQVLAWIGELYGLERSANERKLTAEARREMRQTRSRPILERIAAYLDTLALTELPKSPLAKAVSYARNHWAALCRYTEDGRLKIDNNGAEQALRPIVTPVSLCSTSSSARNRESPEVARISTRAPTARAAA